MANITANLEARYNVVDVFLNGSADLAKRAKEIENGKSPITDSHTYLSYVAGSIMLSVSALDAEIWSLFRYGPGHHLGSNGIDAEITEKLARLDENAFKGMTKLEKVNYLLSYLGYKKLDIGSGAAQQAKLVLFVRNEITHYKSKGTSEIEYDKNMIELEKRNFSNLSLYNHDTYRIPFVKQLSYNCAKWSFETIIDLINDIYVQFEAPSPLQTKKDLINL